MAAVAALNATEEGTPAEATAGGMEGGDLADFLETAPTSVVGFRAVLKHAVAVDCGCHLKDIVDTLLKSPI